MFKESFEAFPSENNQENLQEALKGGKEEVSEDHVLSTAVVVVLFLSVIVIISAIAIVIRMVRKNSDASERASQQCDEEMADPYLQAIMFPNDPRNQWYRQVKTTLKTTGKKLIGKGEPVHKTTIPENLKPQLRHIYVY